MPTVRAKFKVDRISRVQSTRWVTGEDGKSKAVPVEMRSLVLSPVYGNGDPEHENTKFWNATPSGKLELDVVNLPAVDHIDLGKEYYIDIIEA